MNIIKTLTAAALLTASSASFAGIVNVDGVIWNTDQAFALPSLVDFESHGGIIETALTSFTAGQVITGSGQMDRINSAIGNAASFCPGCELTYTFSMTLVSATLTDFTFSGLVTTWYVDHASDAGFSAYNGTSASASNGNIFLTMVGNGNLIGTGTNIGTGSDTGTGSALLDVTGGLAKKYFDTNTKLNGSDIVFSSSFQPISGTNLLSGTIDYSGNTVSVPEPASLALLGLGLTALGFGKRRKA